MVRILFLLSLIILVASFPLINNWLSNNGQKNTLDKSAVESIVEDYINNNPQKILNSISLMKNHRSQDEASENIKKFKNQIVDSSYPSTGNQDSKVTLVEFFDYSCGYCKMMVEDVKQLIQDNKVRYVFRDLPILGEGSVKAARAALAVNFIYPDKYPDFYYAALSHQGRFDDDVSVLKIIRDIGINEEEFNKSLSENSEKIDKMIENSKQLARDLNIGGTPSMILGDSLLVGAIDLATLRDKITELGKK